MPPFELGLYTFGDITPELGGSITPQQRLLDVVDEARLAALGLPIGLVTETLRQENPGVIDQDLPPFKIDQNNFSKLLRKTLNAFRASDSIDISLKLLFGQHVIIDEKKESIAQLAILANGRYADTDEEIRTLAEVSQIKCILKEHSIKLEIPLIQ